MEWAEIPEAVVAWSQALAPLAGRIKRAAAAIPTVGDVGYYVHPGTLQVGLVSHRDDLADLAACKAAVDAADPAVGIVPLFLSHQGGTTSPLDDPAAAWVKVAHSPALRRLGALLNFFPGQYPGGLPNHPGPTAAVLTSGLLGAGLGYGAGRLASRLLPRGYGDHLGPAGAVLGGLVGATPGAAWGYANHASGHGLDDPWPLDQTAPLPPTPVPPQDPVKAAQDALAAVPVPARVRRFLGKQASTLAGGGGALEVNIDALGRTLWQSGASPQLAGATMGAMFAAQQLPDPRSRPGVVTGNQLGQLAMGAAGDYTKGLLVGHALNAVIGTPFRPGAVGLGVAALGVIGSVVPRLFGAR